jgi:hypothetical protein
MMSAVIAVLQVKMISRYHFVRLGATGALFWSAIATQLRTYLLGNGSTLSPYQLLTHRNGMQMKILTTKRGSACAIFYWSAAQLISQKLRKTTRFEPLGTFWNLNIG